MRAVLGELIIEWNWEGPDGILPTPREDPDVVESDMSLSEYVWIVGKYGRLRTSPEEQEKKAEA